MSGDPAWTDEDWGYALAWQQERAAVHTCGQPTAESFGPENQAAYLAEVIRCQACAAHDRAVETYRKHEGADMAGIQTRLVRGPHGRI